MIEGQFHPRQQIQFVPDRIFFQTNAVNFDGTNDRLTRDAALTDIANGKLFTFSVWVNPSTDAATRVLLRGSITPGTNQIRGLDLILNANDAFAVEGRSTGTTDNLDATSSTDSVEAADGWVHILASFNMGTGAKHIYINDVSDYNEVTFIDANFAFTEAGDWSVGGATTAAARLTGDMAELWFTTGVTIDFSVEANRRKFRSAAGKPVYLGLTGEVPTGTAPLVYMSGATDAWHTNKGTGGGFTEVGEITTAAASPSNP